MVVDTWAMRGARAVLVFKDAIDLTSEQTNLIEPASDDEQNIRNYHPSSFCLAGDPQFTHTTGVKLYNPDYVSCLSYLRLFFYQLIIIHPSQSINLVKCQSSGSSLDVLGLVSLSFLSLSISLVLTDTHTLFSPS
jgi:hypothetical protein